MELIRTLAEIARKMNSSVELSDILPTILETAKEYIGVGRVSVFFKEDGILRMKAWAGFEPKENLEISLGEGISGQVAASGTKYIVNHGASTENGYTSTSFLSIPVRSGDDTMGVLNFTDKKDDFFNDNDVEIAEYIAFQCSLAAERSQLYAQRREDDGLKALGLIRASLAHDIRNLLGIVEVYLSLIGDTDDMKTIYEYVDAAKAEISLVKGVAEDVIGFGRGTVANLKRSDFDLHYMCRSITEQFNLSLKYTDIDVRLKGESVVVNADEKKLFRAIFNLTNNAVQAVSEGGHVTLKTKRIGGMAYISIFDNGKGIKKELIPEIFKLFVTSEKKGGTGLGLAIVRQVIIAHKGGIKIRSQEGRYTIFRINIPVSGVEA